MTDIEKAFRNGTLDVFDVDRKNVQKLTHYLVDADTGEVCTVVLLISGTSSSKFPVSGNSAATE